MNKKEVLNTYYEVLFGEKLRTIFQIVCEYYGLPIEDAKSNRRFRPLVMARKDAFYLSRKYTGAPLAAIGEFIGSKDHATVLFHSRRMDGEINTFLPNGKRIDQDGYDRITELSSRIEQAGI